MRAITKRQEPPSLTAHRQTPHCGYENYTGKDELRAALVAEQRGLCCYCMGRIESAPNRMKIEHWRCQSRNAGDQLSYRNLLGACRGGHGQPATHQHCDTRKGERDLRWNPADPDHQIERRVRYGLDGSIRSDDVEFNTQLEDILNLNLAALLNSRKAAMDAVHKWWKWERDRLRGRVPRDRILRKRDEYVRGYGDLQPYCQVAIWLLDYRLSRTCE